MAVTLLNKPLKKLQRDCFNMRVLMVGPIETKERYKGGVALVMESLINNRASFEKHNCDIFFLDSYQIRRKKTTTGKFTFENIRNYFTVKKAIKKENKVVKPDSVYIHSSRGIALIKDLMLLSKAKASIKILHIHYAELAKILPSNFIAKRIALKLLKKVPTKIVTLSKKTKEELVSQGVLESKIKTIYNFHTFQFNDDEIQQKIKKFKKRNSLNLLFVGSIDRRKGIVDLLKALSSTKISFTLNICGSFVDENIKKECENICLSEENKERINFNGYISGDRKRELYFESDVLILPSYGEGFPLVLMEAIASGCYVITTKVGAIPEVFDQKTGSLLTPGDVDALKISLDELLSKQKIACVMESNYYLSKQFSVDCFVENIIELLEEPTSL